MARQIGYIYAKQPLVDDCCPSPETCYCDGDMIHHGDFYDSVSPSENIWKKFELLPTPPLSPQREDACITHPLSRKANTDEDWLTTTICFDTHKSSSDRLKSKLIQDCMWSGTDEMETRSTRTRTVSLSELTMIATSTSCVDPTTVFPQPLNQEHSYSLTTPEPTPAQCTPAPTDSESEEVDVITVESSRRVKMASTKRMQPIVTATTIISHSGNRVKHNLTAVAARLNKESHKHPKCISDYTFCIPPNKKRKFASSLQSSRSSSDSEEFSGEGRRSQHNVLERKRRNDLKSSFLKLRDQLPGLKLQERAPKVTILSNATDFVHSLRLTERRLIAEVRELRERNHSLKRRLDQPQL